MFELNVELGASGSINIRRDLKFGECSIFDVNIESADEMPFELPMQRYLEEMLVGMHGSPAEKCEKTNGGAKVRANWQRLKSVLGTQAAQDACRALFGIVLGVVLNHATENAVAEFQQQLARAWTLVVQEVKKEASKKTIGMGKESDIQDEILRVLPVVFVQCIYRLMVDAFPEDKNELTHHAEELLEKLTQVVTHEVYGFKLYPETSQKERRLVFQKSVIDSPFINQQDTLKSQMRAVALEKRSKDYKPLCFGALDAMPLEESQLEHVMMGRSMARQKAIEFNLKDEAQVPMDLSVDRYDSIADIGERLFDRHYRELNPEMDAMTTMNAMQCSVTVNAERPDSQGAKGDSFEDASTRASYDNIMAKRREVRQAAKKNREELLQSQITKEPLPAALQTRNIDTNWVSPLMDRVVPAERHRQGLQKRTCDSRHLKMDLPQSEVNRRMLESRSEPSLRRSVKLPKIGGHHGNDAIDHVDDHHHHLNMTPVRKAHKIQTQLFIEPPARLSNSVVLHRLEDHVVHFKQKSFGSYLKEVDISSGAQKHRMDPSSMRRAEDAYVSSLHALVGPNHQSALKLYDSPERTSKKRMKAIKKMSST